MLDHLMLDQDSLHRLVSPSASLTGTQIQAGITAAGGHSWTPQHNGKSLLFCKGAALRSDGTAGFLAVHLVDDPVGTWYLLDLQPDDEGISGAEFDMVGDSTLGTTVALDAKLYIYPGLYSQGNA